MPYTLNVDLIVNRPVLVTKILSSLRHDYILSIFIYLVNLLNFYFEEKYKLLFATKYIDNLNVDVVEFLSKNQKREILLNLVMIYFFTI